jgi:hypothetical protein
MKVKLNKIFFMKIFFILLIIFSIGINITYSKSIFMPVSEIKPGMKGVGKTVFYGTKIDTFQVDIIDVVKGEGGINNFILAYLSGEKIEKSGGISEGMSGSPVYINNKLIGAVSYAWEMSEHNLCLITPIYDMLKIANFSSNYGQLKSQEYKLNHTLHFVERDINKIVIKNKIDEGNFLSLANQREIVFYPVTSSLTISGLRDRSFDKLSDSLKRFNLKAIEGVNNINEVGFQKVGERSNNKIEAGSAIGIQLARGDVNITSIGTVTYRKGNKLLALGHPFLKKGDVSFLLSAIYIYHSLPNIVMPFKLGSPLYLIGSVVQDRQAGILALINSYPRIIPLKVRVEDINSGLSYQTGVQLINDYDLLDPLISNITIQAIDNALNRIGAGSAQVEIKIKGRKKGQELCRNNMYYSSDDIATCAITEIPEIIDLIANNYFESVDLTAIDINIKIDKKKKIGKLEEVVLKNSSLRAGDLLKAKVKIRPFRESLIEKIITIQIPSNISSGEALLTLKGGRDLNNQQDDQVCLDCSKKDYKNLEEVLKDISDRPKGNQIIGEVINYSNDRQQEEKIVNDLEKEEDRKNLLTSKIEIDMVVEGYLETPFTILEN